MYPPPASPYGAPPPVSASAPTMLAAPPSPVPPSPFDLVPNRDDTELFRDARVGFSHLLPGKPVLGMMTVRPDEPPADAIIHLQDAPITLRYKLESPAFSAPTAAELARLTAERFAGWRAQQAVGVDFANA